MTSTGTRDHRSRVGRHQGAEHAAAELVALCVLRDDRVGARLLGRLSGLAAGSAAIPRACSAIRRAPTFDERMAALAASRAGWSDRIADQPRSSQIADDPQLLDIADGRRPARSSPTTARPVTAPAAQAGRRLSRAGRRRLAVGRHRRGHLHDHPPRHPQRRSRDAASRRCRPSARRPADAASRSTTSPTYVLSLSAAAGQETRARAAAVFAEQLRRLPRRDGQGQPGAGRAQPDRPDLALRRRARRRSCAQVTKPHQGVMPTWAARLGDVEIKEAATYVHSLGGGQ